MTSKEELIHCDLEMRLNNESYKLHLKTRGGHAVTFKVTLAQKPRPGNQPEVSDSFEITVTILVWLLELQPYLYKISVCYQTFRGIVSATSSKLF